MASDPRPTVLAAPSSSPTHGLLGSILSPLPSAPSSSSSTAHPTPSPSPPPPQSSFPVSQADDGRRRPARKGVVGQAERALKWVVGYDDAAPRQIGSSDYVRELTSNPGEKLKDYLLSLFPIVMWLPFYNISWALADLIAGITVGLVLVPQSMSYAKLAGLEPQYGLYSSFIGVMVYAFFATSKDVSIGPVAVMSLETGRIIADVVAEHGDRWAPEVIATQLAFICGFVVLAIGLLRLGWIVEFIPAPAVAGFMTGSAISIAAGQVPALLGLTGFDTKAATYKVIIETLKHLKHADLNAALGIPALVFLYAVKWSCRSVEARYPRWRKVAFFTGVLRNALVIIVFTIVAWRITIHEDKAHYSVSILKDVPAGFQDVGLMKVDPALLSAFAGKIPVATIILLLEHISIAKSFGRVNNYKINPNQELIAIGTTNLLGVIFHAYPATGSFSRSALKSKSGVRTPAAGWWTGICVIIALYALTDAFYYIPNAILSAVIIHAVADLVVSPRGSFAFWRISPVECVIFLAAVIVSVFVTIEAGIYTSLAASVVVLLFRIARPGGAFLGRVQVGVESRSVEDGKASRAVRDVYLPFNHKSGVHVEPPPDGIVIYRFEESMVFPNASYHNSALVDHVKTHTRRGKPAVATKRGDRAWNDPGASRWGKAKPEVAQEANDSKPLLRAVVLDFAAVANLDTTGVQNLVDTRKEIERWSDGPVSFHFSGIISPWVQRALVAGGFGMGGTDCVRPCEVATVTPHTQANLQSVQGPTTEADGQLHRSSTRRTARGDVESEIRVLRAADLCADGTQAGGGGGGDEKTKGASSGFARDPSATGSTSSRSSTLLEPLVSLSTPFFHFDLEEAVRAATAESRLERPKDFKPAAFSAH